MSCGIALVATLLLSDPAVAASAAAPSSAPDAPVSVAAEPLFAGIIQKAGALKTVVDGWSASGAAEQAGFFAADPYRRFRAEAEALAASDLQGHLVLKERGVDGDLKCILRGISEDLPVRLQALETAPNAAERAVALSELSHLLDDNVAVITAPPKPPV